MPELSDYVDLLSKRLPIEDMKGRLWKLVTKGIQANLPDLELGRRERKRLNRLVRKLSK